MKNSKIFWTFSFCVLFWGTTLSFAQERSTETDVNEVKIKKRTIMGRFAPELVLSAEQRLAMKNNRKEEAQRKLAILDTLQISDRRKRKLLRDVKYSPFSDRLNKAVIVTTDFEDEVDNNK